MWENTAPGSGAASTWGWGGRSLERTQRGKAAGDGGFASKGDAPCFCCAQGNTILCSKDLLAATGLPCTTPQLDQSSRELQAEGEKGSWGNHLPLGTKSQELPGTGGLSQGVTQSWDDLQEQTKTTGSTNF